MRNPMKPAIRSLPMLSSLLCLLLLLAAPGLAAAADACPLLRAQTGSQVVATRIAAVACEEHLFWYRPFIDLDGMSPDRACAKPKPDARERRTGLAARRRLLARQRPARAGVDASGCQRLRVRRDERICVAGLPCLHRRYPWSAAFVSYVMRRAQVPGFSGSPSHVSYVRDAYRNPPAMPTRSQSGLGTADAGRPAVLRSRLVARIWFRRAGRPAQQQRFRAQHALRHRRRRRSRPRPHRLHHRRQRAWTA